MNCLSSLGNESRPLVLDTSVLISLNACGYGERVLSVIPNAIIVPRTVAEELEHETSLRNGGNEFLKRLIEKGAAHSADLTTDEYLLFGELTSNSSSLNDGEAATIAVAAKRGFLPVIDERRGRSRAAGLIDPLQPGWSLDILNHPSVIEDMGVQTAVEALYFALRHGRMRIPHEKADQVIALLGTARAVECTCLPRYRERFWPKQIL